MYPRLVIRLSITATKTRCLASTRPHKQTRLPVLWYEPSSLVTCQVLIKQGSLGKKRKGFVTFRTSTTLYSLSWGRNGYQRVTNMGIWPVKNQIRQSRITKNPCSSPADIRHDPMRDCSTLKKMLLLQR